VVVCLSALGRAGSEPCPWPTAAVRRNIPTFCSLEEAEAFANKMRVLIATPRARPGDWSSTSSAHSGNSRWSFCAS